MMIETVQQGYLHKAMPDFEALMKLTEDRENVQICEQEIANIRKILRENRRDAELKRRIFRGRLNRRWSRHATVDDTCSALSLFNLRF